MVYERNRQTELLINLDDMEYNYNQIKQLQPDKEILPVLKASGYGIGAENVAKFVDKVGIKILGTAFVDEGVVLRAGWNYKGEIVVLNQPSVEDIANIIKYDIVTGVCYIEFVKTLNKKAEKEGKKAKIHIEIETGMGRTGVNLNSLEQFIKKVKTLKNIEVEGIYSHFATSDNDLEYAKMQIEKFNKAVNRIKKQINTIKYVHIGNSAGTARIKHLPGNMVRPGIMLYGYYPDENLKDLVKLKPCTILKSKISFIKEVEPGTSISYGRTYVTNKKTLIANVPIGYADGIKRSLSNKGSVVIKGKKVPIVGTICMDSFMIDVTGLDVKIGDDVYIWDNDKIKVEEIAKQCGTINYEILCTISNRVIRKAIN